jgi:hypothetical protein
MGEAHVSILSLLGHKLAVLATRQQTRAVASQTLVILTRKTQTMKLAVKMAGAVALATVIGGMLSVPASAQARPALVQDRDQAGRNHYYAQDSCSQVTFSYCGIKFPTPPAGKRLIVTNVSILNLLPQGQAITSIDLRYLNGSIINFLNSQLNPGTAQTLNYTTNEQVFAKFDPGEIPQLLVFLSSNANMQMVATISGYMIDIP